MSKNLNQLSREPLSFKKEKRTLLGFSRKQLCIPYGVFLTCFVVTFIHVVLLWFSFYIIDNLPLKLSLIKILSPLTLIGLGVYKIICFF